MIIFINNKGTSSFVKLLSVLIDLFVKVKWFRFFLPRGVFATVDTRQRLLLHNCSL